MKKILLISLVITAFLSSCGDSGKNKNEAKKKDANIEVIDSKSTDKEMSAVQVLTYKKFLKEVWDIERHADSFAFQGSRPCVIDFYATWCGPCKKVAPIIEKLAKEYEGKVDFYKIDTDAEPKLASILKITNIPMVFFMKEGEQPMKSVGARSEDYYRAIINKMLSE